ncbi:hypothetical protein HNY73_006013 [Argiope bruennichi]|uniref:Uncharacterized protein n=1 Tax=Argiope bruennichi TaxID=94029 RepID=A0A8T0FL31_ARGBR|nr:hypothetical protein HNY73_006013 [Argiope bruennichi]
MKIVSNKTGTSREYTIADINLENYSNDQAKQESVEYITTDINLPSNLDSLECEAANNSDASYKIPESEIVHEKHSCKRPDITEPDIFFPFPIPRSSLHSRNQTTKELLVFYLQVLFIIQIVK